MITHKLLRKILKYTLILLTSCCLVYFLFSCKSKKQLTATPKDLDNKTSFQKIQFSGMYIDACAARMKGNLKEALDLFIECRKIDPNSIPVKYELATVYKLLGNIELATENAKLCAESNPKNEWYQLILIDCYNANKQYTQSIKLYESLVKNFPSKTEFKEDLAVEYARLGQFDKSFKIYDELEKIYGANEQLTIYKVKLLKEQKKYKEAESELLKLSASNPTEGRYYAYLAEFYEEQHNSQKTKEMYDKIVEVDPNNPTVNLALSDYYNALNKPTEAFDYLKKAFENPDLDAVTKASITYSYYKRAEERPESNYKKEGIELTKIFLQVHPQSPEANGVYADFLMLDGKTKEAANYYYISALNEKSDFRIWNQLLFLYDNLRQYDSLEHLSSRAMELFPSQPITYFFNGFANIQLSKYKKAAQSLKDGLEFVVDNKVLMKDFLSNLGDAYNYTKEYQKSDKAFEDALKIDSDNTYVLNNYAYYLSLRNENLEKAEKLSKKTNELQPNNRNYMDTYGWILFQQKKYKEAEEWLGNASKMGPKNPNILEHYGDVLFKLNKPEEAFIQWNLAKQAGGSSELLLKKIKEKKLND
ncbi:MAG: tetratricopeptide repeat protein [Bacteroidota bacterium]|nr:tetratricopeptide repeat protein [Bacteroidota bacterium]